MAVTIINLVAKIGEPFEVSTDYPHKFVRVELSPEFELHDECGLLKDPIRMCLPDDYAEMFRDKKVSLSLALM